MIRLKKISAENLWDVVDLRVKKEQKNFVAANANSLLEAYLAAGSDCTAFPFAIYDDKKLVGFLMIGYNEAAMYELYGEKAPEILRNNYSLWRFMIDRKYQNRGYGREALRLALDFVRTLPCGEAEYCELSYEPENTVARDLYRSFGFVETGDRDGDEIIAVLKL
jgi:diamine N-acetyltransferase